jgi:hypothetical protein
MYRGEFARTAARLGNTPYEELFYNDCSSS